MKEVLTQYIALLNCCWKHVEKASKLDKTRSFLLDWKQANWELLVEGLLDEPNSVLEPYGEGADCNPYSSRVLYPDRMPTHRLICKGAQAQKVYDHISNTCLDTSKCDIFFDSFVSLGSSGWYREAPPFDKILGYYQDREVVIDFDKVDVELYPINP